MTHWLTVFLYEARQQFRRQAYLFVTFMIPLLAVVGFYGYQVLSDMDEDGEEDAPRDPVTSEIENAGTIIGYVDRSAEGLFPPPESERYETDPETCIPPQNPDGGTYVITADVIQRVSSPYCWQGAIHAYPTLDAAEDALADGEIDTLYLVETDYLETGRVVQYMQGLDLELIDADQLFESYLIASMLYDVESASTYGRLYLRLRDPAVITEHQVSTAGTTTTDDDEEGQNFVMVYGFGMVMMLSLLWGGGYLMQSVVQEKESRIIEIVLSSVQPVGLLTGKVLAMGMLSLLQVGMLLGTFVFLGTQAGDIFAGLGDLDIDMALLPIAAVYFVLGFLMFGSLMAGIASLANSMRESQQFVVVVTLPAVFPFFFLTFFAEEPNGTLAQILSIVPITAPLSMIMRASVTAVPAVELALSILLLIGMVAFTIWFSGRLFRVNTLLSGNTPKLRDIPKLLRG
ncbi:MAG: ABC transporter permease [Chloroflexi bacterium]|nr:ABC transporter permease [Chloroflexota bacterium]